MSCAVKMGKSYSTAVLLKETGFYLKSSSLRLRNPMETRKDPTADRGNVGEKLHQLRTKDP